MIKPAFFALLLPFAGPTLAEGFSLGLPIDCDLTSDACYIQQYMDHDPTKGVTDFKCHGLSYDGHKGTDFGLPTLKHMMAGVPVIASAPGTITGMRDGMPDTGYSDETADSIKGRECGNGVVIRHQDGWETQYCHLRQGSITVKKGQSVATGTPLGYVGKSGRAAFPHLHLSVRKNGQKIDPFDPDGVLTCGASGGATLWETTPEYTPGGILDLGLTTAIPDYTDIKAGTATSPEITQKASAIVLFGFTFGTRKGDILRLTIKGPTTTLIDEEFDMLRAQAQSFRAVGKERRRTPWPAGIYTGTVALIRGAQTIETRTTTRIIR
jgi:hypothetical protein